MKLFVSAEQSIESVLYVSNVYKMKKLVLCYQTVFIDCV